MAKFLLTPAPIVLSPEAKAAQVQQAVTDVNMALGEMIGAEAETERVHAMLDKVQAQINLVAANLNDANKLKAICESGALEALGVQLEQEMVATEFLGSAFQSLWKGIVWIYEKIKALLKWLYRFIVDALTTLNHKVNNIKNAKSYNPTDEKLPIMSSLDYKAFGLFESAFIKRAIEFSGSVKTTLVNCKDPVKVAEISNDLAGTLEALASEQSASRWIRFNRETLSLEITDEWLKAHEPKTLVEAGFKTLEDAKAFVSDNDMASGKMSGAHKRYWQGLQTAFYNASQPPFAIFQMVKQVADGGTSPMMDQLNRAATACRGIMRLQAQITSIQHRMESETVKIVECLNRACSGKEAKPADQKPNEQTPPPSGDQKPAGGDNNSTPPPAGGAAS